MGAQFQRLTLQRLLDTAELAGFSLELAGRRSQRGHSLHAASEVPSVEAALAQDTPVRAPEEHLQMNGPGARVVADMVAGGEDRPSRSR